MPFVAILEDENDVTKVIEIQDVESISDTVQALMLSSELVVDISELEIYPEYYNKNDFTVFYNRNTHTLTAVAVDEYENIGLQAEEIQAMQLLEQQRIKTRLDSIEETQALILLSIQKGE